MDEQSGLIRFFYDLIDKKYVNFIRYIDREVAKNLRESNIQTRPVQSNGLWCCILLPSVLILNTILNKVSTVYCLVTCISLSLLCYGLLFVIFMSVSCCVLNESFYSGFVASSLVSTLLMYTVLQQELTYSLLFSLLSVYSYDFLLRYSIMRLPKTFTIGEAMIVTQSILLYGSMIVAKLSVLTEKHEPDLNTIVVNTVLATVALISVAVYTMPETYRGDMTNLAYVLVVGALFTVALLNISLGLNWIFIILHHLFLNRTRLKLFALWAVLVGLAVCALLVRTKYAVKADTVTRKTFHVLASAVFLSGILFDVELITLAAGVGLGVLILIEMLRKSNIEPISKPLQSAFLIYCDEKDSGSFAMTPLYLYCGLACPLILTPVYEGREMELLSGVLSIGIGDSAASWFGSCYGFNKWPGTSKSLEGTLFNILSQILTVYTLQLFDLLHSRNALIRTAIAATITGLVEAKTEQIDNLILPLVSLISFQITLFLR